MKTIKLNSNYLIKLFLEVEKYNQNPSNIINNKRYSLVILVQTVCAYILYIYI